MRPISCIYGKRSGSVKPSKAPHSGKVTDFYDNLMRGDSSVPVERIRNRSINAKSRPLTSQGTINNMHHQRKVQRFKEIAGIAFRDPSKIKI